MTNTRRRSLGIYGPYGADRSGIARYIESSSAHLEREYRISVISNASEWIDPWVFDATLYHLGNNRMHRSAFEAARIRPGVALVHEYLHLDYYYQAWGLLDQRQRDKILNALTAATGITAETLDEFLDRCGQDPSIDPYAIDISIEKYVIRDSLVSVVHSEALANLLTARYPRTTVRPIPFPVEPWPEENSPDYLSYYGVPKGSFTFGSFGFIGEYKKIQWITAAWRGWQDRPADTRLLLVGERQIEVDVDAEGIIALGYVDDVEFARLLASIDCGIQLREPSLGETSGPTAALVVHGRPAILSDIPEMRVLDGGSRTTYVKSDDRVIDKLISAMKAQYMHGREPLNGFDSGHSWEHWTNIMLNFLSTGS